jgi:hypothetical protein
MMAGAKRSRSLKIVASFATFFSRLSRQKTSPQRAKFRPQQILEKSRFDNMLQEAD